MNHRNGAPRAAVAAILARQHGAISRSQALEAGLSRRQIERLLANGEWLHVYESTFRHATAPATPEQQLMAAVLATSGAASHRSAGLLRGLDVPVPPVPEITTPSRRELDGILVHRTRRFVHTQIERLGPFPVTKPARTMIDLAGVLRPWDVESAFDSGLRTEAFTLDGLERVIDAHGARGFAGVALLRDLIENRRVYGVPRSPLETRVWKRFDEADVVNPQRNVVVHDEFGNRLGELDLCWLCAKVGVECQSYRHHFGRHPWRADIVKLNRFTAAGWLIFPATEEEAGRNFHVLLRQVKQALANRGA